MTNKEKVEYLKEIFNKFLKDNDIYDAWYERYRLDNLMYDDEVSIDKFIEDRIEEGEHGVHSMFYYGMGETVWKSEEILKFIKENKKCGISDNGHMASMDRKWMDSWRNLVNINELFDKKEE